MPTAGYSGKALVAKLGLKPGAAAAAIDPPAHYAALLEGAATPGPFKAGPYDFIHLFVKDRAALAHALPRAFGKLAPGGMIWVSWPKKASPMFKDLTEDGVREAAFRLGLVDVKVCAVDADWSGLKLLRRTKSA